MSKPLVKHWNKTRKFFTFIGLLIVGYIIWPLLLIGDIAPSMTIDTIQGRNPNPFKILARIRSFEDLLVYLAFYFIFAFLSAILMYGGLMWSSVQWPKSSGEYKRNTTTTKQMTFGLVALLAIVGIAVPFGVALLWYFLSK